MPEKTIYKQTPTTYTPDRCVDEWCLGTPALRVVYFLRPTTGEDTDTDDTDTDGKAEREEGAGDVSSFSLALAFSRARVLLGSDFFRLLSLAFVCGVLAGTGTGDDGTQRGHNSSRTCCPRGGAFDLMKARMSSAAASHSTPAANTAWTDPALRTTHRS